MLSCACDAFSAATRDKILVKSQVGSHLQGQGSIFHPRIFFPLKTVQFCYLVAQALLSSASRSFWGHKWPMRAGWVCCYASSHTQWSCVTLPTSTLGVSELETSSYSRARQAPKTFSGVVECPALGCRNEYPSLYHKSYWWSISAWLGCRFWNSCRPGPPID